MKREEGDGGLSVKRIVMLNMKKLILHIGTEKTGTTSIQNTLKANSELLKNKGILYPSCFKFSNHIEICVAFQNYDENSDLYSVICVGNKKENVENYRKKFLSKLENEIKTSDCETIVISNEHLHSRLRSNEEISELKSWCENNFSEITVCVYLRKQVDLAISHFSTSLKFGSVIKNPLPENAINDHYYNYQKFIDLWKSFFSNIVIAPFNRETLYESNVVKDFIHNRLRIRFDKFKMMNESNHSLGIRSLAFLYHLNQKLPRIVNNRLNSERMNLVRFLEEISPEIDKPLSISFNLKNDFQRLFEQSNKYLKDIEPSVAEFLEGQITSKGDNYEEFLNLISDDENNAYFLKLWHNVSKYINILESKNNMKA